MLFVYNMADKYFLNTCSGQQCKANPGLIANQIAHLTTNKPIKSSRCKKIQREAINLLLLPTKSIHYSGDEKEALPKYCSVLRYTSKIAYFGEILKQEWAFDVSRELRL